MRMPGWSRVRNGRREHGVVLIWFVLILTVLLTVAAFSIDLGYEQVRAAQAQRAADAASLAGAPYLTLGYPTQAHDIALNIAGKNGFVVGSEGVTSITTANIDGNSQFQVTIKLNSPSFFARVVGITQFAVTRSSTSTYDQGVKLGNASNVFGNEPYSPKYRTGPTPTVQPGFWANISGPLTKKRAGDPDAGLFCATKNDDNVPEHVYGCNEPDGPPNIASNDRTFTYDISKGSTGPATIQIFDPMFLNQGTPPAHPDPCENSALNHPDGNGRFDAGANNPACTDDDSLGAIDWEYRRDPDGSCGDPKNPPRSATAATLFGSPESFAKKAKGGVKTAALPSDKPLPPPGTPVNDDELGCEAQDFPITSFTLFNPDGSKACGPVSWDIAPAYPTTIIDPSDRNKQLGDFPPDQVPSLDGNSQAVQIQREKQRVYDFIHNLPAGYTYQQLASGVDPSTLPNLRLPMEAAPGFQPGVGDPAASPAVKAAAQTAWYTATNRIAFAFRNWVDMSSMGSGCKLNAGAGNYKLQVRTDTYVDGNVQSGPTGGWYRGKGANAYSIRVFGFDAAENNSINIAADLKQDIFTQLGSGSSYVARVVESTGQRVLHLTFYDVGDSASGSGVKLQLFAADATGAAVPSRLNGVICTARLSSPTGTHPLAVTSGPCTIQIPDTSLLDGQLLSVDLPIPDSSSGYTCPAADQFNCWIKGSFTFDGGAKVSDATVWTATMSGAPTRITK